jgi:hypothetical protein
VLQQQEHGWTYRAQDTRVCAAGGRGLCPLVHSKECAASRRPKKALDWEGERGFVFRGARVCLRPVAAGCCEVASAKSSRDGERERMLWFFLCGVWSERFVRNVVWEKGEGCARYARGTRGIQQARDGGRFCCAHPPLSCDTARAPQVKRKAQGAGPVTRNAHQQRLCPLLLHSLLLLSPKTSGFFRPSSPPWRRRRRPPWRRP